MTTSVVDVNIYSVYSENLWNNGTCPLFNSTCYEEGMCSIYTEASFGIGELAALICRKNLCMQQNQQKNRSNR